jgi:hypothetical protein
MADQVVESCPGMTVTDEQLMWVQLHSMLWWEQSTTLDERLHMPAVALQAFRALDGEFAAIRRELEARNAGSGGDNAGPVDPGGSRG